MTKSTLADLIDVSLDGEWGQGDDSPDTVEMYCIRGTDFGAVRRGDLTHVPRRHVAKRHALRKRLKANDILIEVAGGAKDRPTGRTLMVTERLVNSSGLPLTCASFSRFIRVKSDLVNPQYLFWYLQYLDVTNELRPFNTQHTGVARFQWTDFSTTFKFELPPRQQQHEIAEALIAFDDLIENNRRRIEILEEMARLIYREWFVHFRFPGHEDVKLVESNLGTVPGGWDVRPIGEVVDTFGGGTPSKKNPEYWVDPSIAWYTPSDLTKQHAMFAFGSGDQINELGLAKSSAKLFPARTVMMTSRATIGEIAIATTDASTNQGFISCAPSERLSEYHLYFWLHENVDRFLALAGGATFLELRKSTFRNLSVAVPPLETEIAFNDAVGPLCELIENLLRQNNVLSETRDLLLPRLISGELDVSDLDLDLETVG